jgi:hypothetical protein
MRPFFGLTPILRRSFLGSIPKLKRSFLGSIPKLKRSFLEIEDESSNLRRVYDGFALQNLRRDMICRCLFIVDVVSILFLEKNVITTGRRCQSIPR